VKGLQCLYCSVAVYSRLFIQLDKVDRLVWANTFHSGFQWDYKNSTHRRLLTEVEHRSSLHIMLTLLKNNERAHVFSYLQAFDVEDVDLRHSATGGWHGTYVNRLAYAYSFETAPLTHSSIVTDSLFMDVDTKASLRPSSSSDDEEESLGSGSRGYDGLVSAYGDLQPRSYKDHKANLEGKPWGREIIKSAYIRNKHMHRRGHGNTHTHLFN
jgi:hypothetical protein